MAQTGDTPSPPRPATSRWPRRRIRATALHTLVGLLVGSGLTPLMVLAAVAGDRLTGLAPLSYLGAVALDVLILAHATRSSCERHPAAPMGIAIGIGAGSTAAAAALGAAFVHQPGHIGLAVVLALLACVPPVAAYRAGMHTMRRKLGQLREGLGRTCAACAYDLSATPDGWPCPECGGPMRYEFRPGENPD